MGMDIGTKDSPEPSADASAEGGGASAVETTAAAVSPAYENPDDLVMTIEEEGGECDWREAYDTNAQKLYYYHRITHQTVWELSEDMKKRAADATTEERKKEREEKQKIQAEFDTQERQQQHPRHKQTSPHQHWTASVPR